MSERPLAQERAALYWKLAAITAAAAALRLYRLDEQSLWHDEAISVIVSRAPIDRTLDFFRATPPRLPFEYNPPLYGFALHGWFALLGVGGFQARLLSAVVGIVSVPLVLALGARLFGSSAGLYAATLLAVSQLGVMFSQEARNYELFLMLTLVTANLYLIAMQRRSLPAWCLATASAVLMVLTNYYGVFIVLALAAYSLIYWRSIPLLWVAGSVATAALCLVPWSLFALSGQAAAASGRVQPGYFAIGLTSVIGTITRFNNGAVAGLLESTPAWAVALGGMLFGAPILWLIERARRTRRADPADWRGAVFAILLFAVPLAAVLVLGFVANVQYNIRYVSVCIAPYYVLAGAGLARWPDRLSRRLALLAILAYSGYALMANYRVPYKENYRDAVDLVASQASPSDCFAFVPFGNPPLEWSIYSTMRPERLVKLDDGGTDARACQATWVITYERVILPVHKIWREHIASRTVTQVKTAEQQFFWVKVEKYEAVR